MKSWKRVTVAAAMLLLAASCGGNADVTGLRCEMLGDPVGIDCEEPRLSWIIASDRRDVRQTGYRVLAASSPDLLDPGTADLWDSGEVASGGSIQIPYGGKKPESRQECYWKVRVTTNHGKTNWSPVASWTMGLLDMEEWQAEWTGLDRSFGWDEPQARFTRLSARYFRHEFRSEQPVRRAVLYISGLGLYKLYLNGERIGDQELAPTPTDYTKSVKYNTFDVTDRIADGDNAIGVVLGNGRFFTMRYDEKQHAAGSHWLHNVRHFGYPKMILQLEIDYEDGTRQTIISDDNWKVTADGPIRANNEFDGEEYDALKEMPGWNEPGFDDSGWFRAEQVESPGGKLNAQMNPNIKVMDMVEPLSVKEVKPGVWIMDMGQNMVGWVKMRVQGDRGKQVKMRFSEVLNADGTLNLTNIRDAQVTDIYTLKGGEEEVWEPSFTYHGFRYVEITGWPGTPRTENFEGRVVHDEMERTGSFETSDTLLNNIYRNAFWGIRGNYRGMPTDCPQRDERMGWLGDRAAGSLGESFIFGVGHLYAKWLDDVEQTQRESGSLSDIAPNYWDCYTDNMTWPGAYLVIADMLCRQYGDVRPITSHYPSMKRWMDHMTENYMQDHIMTRDQWGDWCMAPVNPEDTGEPPASRITDKQLLGTAYFYYLSGLMERFALLQDMPDDAARYSCLADSVKTAFNEKYFNRERKYYANNTITANMLPLCFGMVPDGHRDAVFRNIVDKTENEFGGHVSAGLVGVQWQMRGLSDNGRADLALRVATRKDYPGWGYMIANGATTIWELWNGNYGDPRMNSHNHVMLLGDLITWFYEYLGGIRNDPSDVGFKKIILKPCVLAGLDHVKTSFRSVHGDIVSNWEKKDGVLRWAVEIPSNTTATVWIPAANGSRINEGGKPVSSSRNLTLVRAGDGFSVFSAESGKYVFTSELP